MNRTKLVQPKKHSSVWIPDGLKNGLVLKTIQDDNRYVSVTLAKVLKFAGIQEITETQLMDFLEFPEVEGKKVKGREAIIAK